MDLNKQPETIAEALALASQWNFKHCARIAELEAALAEEKERWIQEREAWIAQKAECVTLREKLAEAEADSKRLDWLHARMAHVFEWTTGRFGVESRSGRDHWLVRPIYNTPRAAIDAARKGKP